MQVATPAQPQPAETTEARAYTHVGNRPQTGRRYYSDLAHRDTAGRDHALNPARDGRYGYVALCGQYVPAVFGCGEQTDHVARRERYDHVTCRRCRKALGRA